jgi:geranylgeranyl diphosphate synthase, type II
VSAAATPLDAWLQARRAAVDAGLDRFLPLERRAPGLIADAMRYSVFAGGKRLRPMLVLAAAEAVGAAAGLNQDDALQVALPCACAIELIHTYSLVHDDLPAMDNDTLRRGRPTAHVVYGEGTAILSGDALLTEAFLLLAREPGHVPDGMPLTASELALRKLQAIDAIAEAAGAEGMVGGQVLDLAAAQHASPIDDRALAEMHARKTGALLRASAVAGAIMAGSTSGQLAAVREYGTHLGLAFQIVDDILDIEEASAVLGKTAGKDAAAGKPTYPARYGVAESRRRAEDSIGRALQALEGGRLGGQLPAIARWVLARRN